MALDESRELSAVRGGTPREVTEARLWSLPGGRQSSCPSSSLCSAEPVSLQEEQSGVPGCALGSSCSSHWGAAHSQLWCESLSSRNWPRLPRSFRKDSRPGDFTRFIQTHTRGGFGFCATELHPRSWAAGLLSLQAQSPFWGRDHWEQPLLVGEAGK